ncbi:Uncharacterised protein [Mycobacterium tuberculosis]|nr:Uncharacterised protein [Mycobacterium tuberculosis]CKU07917.1 Uncharacterised protein [Mycobacterium tuberculosis]
MNAMLVRTASSWGVTASSIMATAPTVACAVSSRVKPVNTRIVVCCSVELNVCQDARSLESGIFSGNQKLPVKRSQTCKSLASSNRFQLIACTRSTSLPVIEGRPALPWSCRCWPVRTLLWASSPAVGPWAFRPSSLSLTVFHGVHQHCSLVISATHILFFVSLNSLQTAITAHTVTRRLASSRRRRGTHGRFAGSRCRRPAVVGGPAGRSRTSYSLRS